MEKNQKIVVIISLLAILIIIIASIFIFVRKVSMPKSPAFSAVENKNSTTDIAKEEAAYKVENKEDAKKALEDINSLVESAGDSSL